MLKKFLDLFFAPEEEEEEIEEVEKEKDEISLKDFEEIVKDEIKKEETVNTEAAYTEPVKEKVEVKTRPSFDVITADGVAEVKMKKKPRVLRREEYDIQPVISPYFGVKSEEKAPVKVEKKTTPVYRKETKKSEYSEVISPIYGVKEKPVISKVVEEPTIMKEKKVIEIPSFSSEDDENIALDDILFGKDSGEDDMIQFSLFGDDKRIQEDVFKNEDIDMDDSLPF